VDTNNLTGYSQVLEEKRAGILVKAYTYGLDLISCKDIPAAKTYYFGYDGQGSVRYLTDSDGNVTDTYDYDAFGNLLSRTGTTDNNYLYTGEQWDFDLEMYFLRARYMDTDSGRFWGMDSWEGILNAPNRSHKYLYTENNPVNRYDPSGYVSIAGVMMSTSVVGVLSSMALNSVRGGAIFAKNVGVASGIIVSVNFTLLKSYGISANIGIDIVVNLNNFETAIYVVPQVAGEISEDLALAHGKRSVTFSAGLVYGMDTVDDMAGLGTESLMPYWALPGGAPWAAPAIGGVQSIVAANGFLSEKSSVIIGNSYGKKSLAYWQLAFSSGGNMAMGGGASVGVRLSPSSISSGLRGIADEVRYSAGNMTVDNPFSQENTLSRMINNLGRMKDVVLR
jgi:RHS repeat-associated protein